ncbi:MAG: hypothetical protein U0Y68_04370 [Blastocatellia bacterium]
MLGVIFSAFSLLTFEITGQAQDSPVLKASFTRDASQPLNIDLLVGQSRVIELDSEYDATQFSGKDIVSLGVLTNKVIIVNAVGIGQANVVVAKKRAEPNDPEQVLVFHVFVQKNLTLIDNQIKVLYPKENIQLSQVNDSVVISGSVTRPDIYDEVEKILKAAKIEFSNLLKKPPVSTQQVQMQVRIAEVNRSVLRELSAAYGILNSALPAYINSGGGPAGFKDYSQVNGNATGLNSQKLTLNPTSALNIFLGRADVTSAFITALNSRGAIRDLAEPNIIASNLAKGNFIAGGELPIPVVNSASSGAAAITVQWRPYGVKLEFTPNIKDENHIEIELEPEVSSLDYGNAITLGGTIIPSVRLRRAHTKLELRDGQSFALAGLLDNSESVNYSHVPGLGNIPILGELFKSRRFQRNETELIFLCTVNLVEPLNPDQIPRLPGAPPNSASAVTKPESNATGTLTAPIFNSASPSLTLPASNLLEGDSGHATPKKVTKAVPKTDNPK